MNTMTLSHAMQGSKDYNISQDHEFIDRMIASTEHVIDTRKDKKLPDPIDYLKSVMEQRGLRNMDMKAYLGSSGNISSVLNRHKPLSLKMIRNLNKYLDIPARILIQPYDCH
ncbi:MAG: hypothetical protein K9K37_00665 [Desulfocapsa sp.]|nr:hypothetical protein [Desulfocapsa sp.]